MKKLSDKQRYSDTEKEQTFKEVFERVAKGEAVRNILKDEHLPSSRTFYIWLEEDKVKVKQYACACSARADSIFDEILDIADDQESDTYQKDGVELTNHNVINRAKLRIDARKWVLGKLNPTKYGDRIQQDVTIDHKDMTESERIERIAALKSKLK